MRDALARRTSRLDYALFVKGISARIVFAEDAVGPAKTFEVSVVICSVEV